MRRPKPYCKKTHKAWYLNLNGKNIRLASEAGGEKVAYQEYDKRMARRQPADSNLRVGQAIQVLLEAASQLNRKKSKTLAV